MLGIIIILVIVVELPKVLKRRANGIIQRVAAKENPEALHTSLCAGFDLDGQYPTFVRYDVIHFCLTLLLLTLPVVQFGLRETTFADIRTEKSTKLAKFVPKTKIRTENTR